MGKKNKVFLGILAAVVVVLYLLAGDYLESRVESYADQSYNYSTVRYFYIAYWLIGALLLRVWCFIARERKKTRWSFNVSAATALVVLAIFGAASLLSDSTNIDLVMNSLYFISINTALLFSAMRV